MSGRSPPLYCTLTLIDMQGHQKIVASIVLILHWLLVWSKYSVQNSSVTFTIQTVIQYYTVRLIIYPFRMKQRHGGEDFVRT